MLELIGTSSSKQKGHCSSGFPTPPKPRNPTPFAQGANAAGLGRTLRHLLHPAPIPGCLRRPFRWGGGGFWRVSPGPCKSSTKTRACGWVVCSLKFPPFVGGLKGKPKGTPASWVGPVEKKTHPTLEPPSFSGEPTFRCASSSTYAITMDYPTQCEAFGGKVCAPIVARAVLANVYMFACSPHVSRCRRLNGSRPTGENPICSDQVSVRLPAPTGAKCEMFRWPRCIDALLQEFLRSYDWSKPKIMRLNSEMLGATRFMQASLVEGCKYLQK